MSKLNRDRRNIPIFDRPRTWMLDLDKKDYDRLYKLTLKAYRDLHPGKPDPIDLVIDGMINEIGLKVSMYQLKKAVDGGVIS
jgi:hypothetical protein